MTKKQSMGAHSVSGIFVFLLIGLFAVLAVTLTLIGLRAYRSVSQASVSNSKSQVALSYVLHKAHGFDATGDVALKTFDGQDALCLTEEVDGARYETRIYFYDGYLREYFCEEGEAFDPEFGEAIAELSAFSIATSGPRLFVIQAVQPGGKAQTLHVALRSEEAAQ